MLLRRRRLVIGSAVVVVLAVLAVVGLHVVRDLRRTQLQRALATVPASSLRVTYTDWAAVRAKLKPRSVSSSAGLNAFLDKAFDADLSGGSSMGSSADALLEHYGFSPANASWEVYATGRKGAAMVLRMDDDVDMGAIAHRLGRLGYDEPSDDDGVWRGSADLVASIDPSITPETQNVVVDRDRRLVITSDTAAYAAATDKVAAGDARSVDDSELDGVAGKLGDPAAAYLWRGGFACEDLSMAHADEASRSQATRLVTAAGGVDALDGLAAGLTAAGDLRIVMGFENSDQAKANLRPRAKLFVGPAAGRVGSYADDLKLTRTRTEGSAVIFDARPRQSGDSPLSSVTQGPVLFATC